MNEEFSTTCHSTITATCIDDDHSFAESITQKSHLLTKRKLNTSTNNLSSQPFETFSPFLQPSPKKWRKTQSPSLQLCESQTTSTSSQHELPPPQIHTNSTSDDVDFYEIFRRLETQQKEVSVMAPTQPSATTTKFVELPEQIPEKKVWKRVLEENCVTTGCYNQQIYKERGLCHRCYMKSRRVESILGVKNTKREVYDEVDKEELLELISLNAPTSILATMAGVCCFTDCEKAPFVRSLCSRHYHAALRLKQKKIKV